MEFIGSRDLKLTEDLFVNDFSEILIIDVPISYLDAL